MVLVPVVARKAFQHHGRPVAAGEVFEVPAVPDAVVLCTAGKTILGSVRHREELKASRGRSRRYQRRDLEAEE